MDKNKDYNKKKKIPKKITETYLHNSGLYYLQRYAASANHFKRVMMRKVQKSCMHHKEQDIEKCAEMVNALADKFVSTGIIDDKSYATGSVSSLRRRGMSARAIYARLIPKGLSKEQIETALTKHDAENEDADFDAAILMARRKRLGPFRRSENIDLEPEGKNKELARLARAGFSYQIAQRIIGMEIAEAEEILIRKY